MTKTAINRALEMAQLALAILEEQAAGYTTLTIPAHLQIELEEKRREVVELQSRLQTEVTGPAVTTLFDQRGQQVGTQINVAGDYIGPVLSGQFEGPIAVGGRDAVDLRGSQGAVIKPSGPVTQNFNAAPVDIATLRASLQHLDDVQLEALCLDYFPIVYDKFSRGMRRDERINLLLDYCRRNPEEAARLGSLLK